MIRLDRRSRQWLALQLGLGLLWILVLCGSARPSAPMAMAPWQVGLMLFTAGWLPSIALALWQVNHRRWLALLLSDLLAAGVLVLLALTLYLPLFFVHVAWFLPFALLPRGLVTESVIALLAWRRP